MKTSTHSKLSKKLAGYSALAASAIALTNPAEGQIIYTDVDPDETYSTIGFGPEEFTVDLNGDGMDEMFFTVFDINGTFTGDCYSNGINAFGLGGAQAYAALPSGAALPTDFLINDTLSWDNFECLREVCFGFTCYCPCEGNWSGEGFVGVQFQIDSQNHYGWIRLDATGSSTIVLKDYAYNATPGEAITTFIGPPCTQTTPILTIDTVSLGAIELSWIPLPQANKYRVQYREMGITSVFSKTLDSTSVFLKDLDPGGTYQFRVNALCEDSTQSGWSAPLTYSIPGSCPIPTFLNADPGLNDAVLQWDEEPFAIQYLLQYRELGSDSVYSAISSGNSVVLEDLNAETTYEWRVRADCGVELSAFSPLVTFTTQTCQVPDNLVLSGVFGSIATLNWEPVPFAELYQVRYSQVGDTLFDTVSTSFSSINLDGLLPSTDYQWQVRANCEVEISGFSPLSFFSTVCGIGLSSPNEESSGRFGYSVSSTGGDVNGDGIPDVIVGAYYEDPGSSTSRAGRAYVFDGATNNLLHELISPNKQTNGFFGFSVSSTGGDVNGDGVPDVIVGARSEDPGSSPSGAGRAYVFDGATGNVIHELVSPSDELQGYFGWSVSSTGGDVNGDGVPDVIVGAYWEDPGSSPSNAGRAYIFDGATGNVIHELVSPNEESGGNFGYSVSSTGGDVNGDGVPDVMVGAYNEGPGSSPSSAGRAYVFDGATGNVIHELVSPSDELQGYFGWSVSSTGGDVNGDGVPDVIVGAYWEDPGSSPSNAGRAYIFDGATGNVIHELVSPNEESGGNFGYSVSSTGGDVNSDGVPDVIVGAYNEAPGSSPSDAGRAYVFDAATGNVLHELVSPDEEGSGSFGRSVSSTGSDVNGDGVPDVMVGAYNEGPGSSPSGAGRAYIFCVGEALVCPSPPTPISTNIQSLTTVELKWTLVNEISGYKLFFKEQGSPDSTIAEILDNSLIVDTLTPGQTYEWKVKAICEDSTESDWSELTTFTIPNCEVPDNLISDPQLTSASLIWDAVLYANEYEVQYRAAGDSSFTAVLTTSTSVNLNPLLPSTTYEWQVKADCNAEVSDYSPISSFTTRSCEVPDNLSVDPQLTSAALSWDAVPYTNEYEVQYRVVGDSSFTAVLTTSTSVNLNPLLPSTSYEWQVKADCGAEVSDFSLLSSFTTQSCEVPANLTADPQLTSATLSWDAVPYTNEYEVQYRQTGDTSFVNLVSPSASIDLTGLLPSTTYEWQVKADCNAEVSDFTPLNSFTTQSCEVPDNLFAVTTVTTATLNWDAIAYAAEYEVQYRQTGDTSFVNLVSPSPSIDLAGLSPSTTYEWQVKADCGAEVSDFSSLNTFFTTSCQTPGSLSDNAGLTTAYLSWNAVADANNYEVQYREQGSGTIKTEATINTFITIDSLTPDAAYEWRVRADCGVDVSNYSGFETFITGNSCPIPDNLTATPTLFFYQFSWSAVAEATEYELLWREAGNPDFDTIVTSTNSQLFGGFNSGLTYEWKVRSICGTIPGNFSPLQTFTAALLKQETTEIESTLKVYPNPTRDELIFEGKLASSGEVTIEMLDLTGRIVLREEFESAEAFRYILDVGRLAPGMYIYRVETLEGVETGSVVKE